MFTGRYICRRPGVCTRSTIEGPRMLTSRRRRVVAVLAGLALAAGFSPPAHASNDPEFSRQWGLDQIGAPAAWTKTTGAGGRTGIVDTAAAATHENLAGPLGASTTCHE